MSTVRPVLDENDLGPAGWRRLHQLARQRRRDPRDQVKFLLLFALDASLRGEDTELGDQRLNELLNSSPLESVA